MPMHERAPFNLLLYFDTIDPDEHWAYKGPLCVTNPSWLTANAQTHKQKYRDADGYVIVKSRHILHRQTAPSPVWYEGRKRSIYKVAMHLLRPEQFKIPTGLDCNRYNAETLRKPSQRKYTEDRLPQLATKFVIPGKLCGCRPSLNPTWVIPCCNPFHTLVKPAGRLPNKRIGKKERALPEPLDKDELADLLECIDLLMDGDQPATRQVMFYNISPKDYKELTIKTALDQLIVNPNTPPVWSNLFKSYFQ